jgi:hypothetical protein
MAADIRWLRAFGVLLVGTTALGDGVRLGAAPGSTPRSTVVVELFTSEGCSSCPPADDILSQLAHGQPVRGVEVLALGEHVDYWDRLGWRDPFSSPAFSARQSTYDARVFHANQIYTPQLVIDGRLERVGSNAPAVQRAIEQAATSPKAAVRVAAIRNDADDLRVELHVDMPSSLSTGDTLDAIIAVTEDNLSSKVRRGENGGRTLKHNGVVRSLTTIGTRSPQDFAWSMSASVPWDPVWNPPDVRVIAFLQERQSLHIVGAGSASVDPHAGTK